MSGEQPSSSNRTGENGTDVACADNGNGRRRLLEEDFGTLRGRRLQPKRKGKSGGTASNAAVSTYLIFVLADNSATFFMIMMSALAIHSLITNAYRYVLNRKYYLVLERERKTGVPARNLPKFRPLPSALVFPRFEIMLTTIFVTLHLKLRRSKFNRGRETRREAAVALQREQDTTHAVPPILLI